MIRKWFGVSALVVVASALLTLASCAHNQHLVSINILPGNGTFGAVDPALFFQYRAYGTYVHPPKTVDITNQVTWQSDNPQVAQVTSIGVVSPNTNCGVAQIFATMHDSPNDIVSNQVSITVNGPASFGCTPAGAPPVLTIAFAGAGSGTVTGTGISCNTPNSCTASFTAGTSLTLTATATGTSSFGGWSGCNSTSGVGNSVCSVLIENNVTVTATFN